MNILYIGPYTKATTCQQRGEQLNELLKTYCSPIGFYVIDTHIPLNATHNFWRSLGFRAKKGPLVYAINTFITNTIHGIGIDYYDLIWIDKAVFITEKTTQKLRSITQKLVHYTPDMAFYANRSPHFYRSIHYYDFVITTKSAEIDQYTALIPKEKLIVTTQGFDKHLHYPLHQFEEKEQVVCFVGLCESNRKKLVQLLLDNEIPVKLAGKGWQKFVSINKKNPFLLYIGDSIMGSDYTKFISSSIMSLGLLSKKFPEFHTTRSFEIPACGTALVSERNPEICQYYSEEEAVLFTTPEEMLSKIKFYFNDLRALETVSKNGHQKVVDGGFEYETILKMIVKRILPNI